MVRDNLMFCTPCIVSIYVFAKWISRTWGWVLQICESIHLDLHFANWDVLYTEPDNLKIDRKWLWFDKYVKKQVYKNILLE